MYPNVQKYNKMWSQGKIDRPLVVLIGGYAGTGKSKLAKQLLDRFPFTNILQTAVLRAILRMFISREKNPFLYVHTYDLPIIDVGERTVSLYDRYRAQVEPIAMSINKIVEFAGTEKQQRIIEGAHVLPEFLHIEPSVIPVEIYLKVSDVDLHKRTIAGPTHNRTLSTRQFKTARAIHDQIIKDAKSMGKEVYEIDEAYSKAMRYIDISLERCLYSASLCCMPHLFHRLLFPWISRL